MTGQKVQVCESAERFGTARRCFAVPWENRLLGHSPAAQRGYSCAAIRWWLPPSRRCPREARRCSELPERVYNRGELVLGANEDHNILLLIGATVSPLSACA